MQTTFAKTTVGNSKRGIFREIHGIVAVSALPDCEAYRLLLPTVLAMPLQPIVSVYVASFDEAGGLPPLQWRPYLEAAVRLRCAYQGEVGWFVKTMPVTSRLSSLAGRSIGFPKYIADEITLLTSPDSATGELKHKGTVQLRIEFKPGLSHELTPQEQKALEEGQRLWDPYFFMVPYGRWRNWLSRMWQGPRDEEYTLVPPGEKSGLVRVDPREVVSSTWESSETGFVQLTVNRAASWAGVIPSEKGLLGSQFHWKGGVVMDVQELRT